MHVKVRYRKKLSSVCENAKMGHAFAEKPSVVLCYLFY